VWGKFQSKRKLFARITRFFLLDKWIPVVRQVYLVACAMEQDAFLGSIREILADNPTTEEGRALCALVSAVAFNNPFAFGARGSLELAKIAATSSAFAEFAEQELERHVHAFGTVESKGDVLAIGTTDGWLYTFKKRKPMLELKICDGSIDWVSIGPEMWTLVVSLQDAVGKVVPLTKAGILRPRNRVIAIDVEEWNAGCEIVWGSEPGEVSIKRVLTE
jgi:hypothetical protein